MVRSATRLEARPQSEAERGSVPPRHTRRLFDKIMLAFHHACDYGDIEVAEHLLRLLELMTSRRPRVEDGDRRRNVESLVAAHERFWHLRNPALV